jgi:hypothetical protein
LPIGDLRLDRSVFVRQLVDRLLLLLPLLLLLLQLSTPLVC